MPIPSLALRCCVLLLVVSLYACGKTSVATQATPQGAVEAFYEWRIRSQMTGAPDDGQLAQMAPYITEELRLLLANARPKVDDAKKSKPGARGRGKRAFSEGDLFSSIFDGPTTFITNEVETHGDAHVVPVRLTSARQLPAVNWVDKVKVVSEGGHYLVADIEYGSHWEFGMNATLVGALKDNKKPRRKEKAGSRSALHTKKNAPAS